MASPELSMKAPQSVIVGCRASTPSSWEGLGSRAALSPQDEPRASFQRLWILEVFKFQRSGSFV